MKKITLLICTILIPFLSFGQGNYNNIELDNAKIETVVNTIINSFEKHYVYPEKAKIIKEGLLDNLKTGQYNDIYEYEELIEKIDSDIYDLVEDYHIGFSIIKNSESNKNKNKISLTSEKVVQLAKKNYYFKNIEILSGNIGYLRFDRFSDPKYAGETAIAAMEYLSNTDAIILDLRYNFGGHGTMVDLLSSYFFEEPTITSSLYFPETDSLGQSWTHEVSGKILSDTKLYILTSIQTASAAESFSSMMQRNKRAKIIGERTKGAAHWREYYYYPDIMLEIKMPIGRPFFKDWEGKGIQPDIEIYEYLAYRKAYITALSDLIDSNEDSKKIEELEWYLLIAEKKYQDLLQNTVVLDEYVGVYGKDQQIILRDNYLFWHQGINEEFVLLPFDEDSFVFSDSEDYIVQFVRDESNQVNGYKLLMIGEKDGTTRSKHGI